MKNLVITSIIALLVAGWSIAGAQNHPDEYLGLPGDNLNLYAVMKLFQESETLEDFEKNLNDENTLVNNLDLNRDNYVDYLMVHDYVEGNVHSIVLRVAINKRETQDVAVFTVEQFRDGSVQIQLIGDELLYGKNYIVEPYYAENGETPNPGYMGNVRTRNNVTVVHTTTYQVAEWPLIRFIYLPSYVAWRSSWYWGYRPVYWSPWRPFYWHTYYGYHSHWHHHYYAHYRHWDHYRFPHYRNHYYTSIRTYSPRITVNINKGHYKNTYSRPDLRDEGKALYARKNSGRNSTSYRDAENGRSRSTGTSTVKGARVNTRDNSGTTRSTVRSSNSERNKSGVTRQNTTERRSATVRGENSNSSVRQNSGAERKSTSTNVRGSSETRQERTTTRESEQRRNSDPTMSAEINTNKGAIRGSEPDNRASVSKPAATRTQPAASSRVRTESTGKPAVSTRSNTNRSSVGNSGNNAPKQSAPSVSRKNSSNTKSAQAVSSSGSRSSSQGVSASRSSNRSSGASVSRSSSSRSSSPAARSAGSGSSSRGSGRR